MDLLDQLFNIKFHSKDVSLTKPLLFFYLIIASNFTKNLYAGQLRDLFENNRMAQHVVGFITMLVLITSLSGTNELTQIGLYSVIGYLWFVLTTKLDLHWNLAIILLLFVGYIYENKLRVKDKSTDTDQALDQKEKDMVKNKTTRMRTIIASSILLITGIGTFQYFQKKQGQYGGGFDASKFLFENCKNHSC